MREDQPAAIRRDFERLDDGACFEIDVTGHKLYVRREQGQLIGVRHKPGQVIVEPHEKDGEFVRRMMGWKGYREVPRDEPPFDYEEQAANEEQDGDQQQKLVTDGGRDEYADGIGRYAGGRTCPGCSKTVGIVDYWCRWCGTRLRGGPE